MVLSSVCDLAVWRFGQLRQAQLDAFQVVFGSSFLIQAARRRPLSSDGSDCFVKNGEIDGAAAEVPQIRLQSFKMLLDYSPTPNIPCVLESLSGQQQQTHRSHSQRDIIYASNLVIDA